jgi:hypothetical protein
LVEVVYLVFLGRIGALCPVFGVDKDRCMAHFGFLEGIRGGCMLIAFVGDCKEKVYAEGAERISPLIFHSHRRVPSSSSSSSSR